MRPTSCVEDPGIETLMAHELSQSFEVMLVMRFRSGVLGRVQDGKEFRVPWKSKACVVASTV